MSFVIRSYPRCGTHMIRTALEQHPEIACFNEVFNPDHSGAERIERLGAQGLYDAHTGPKTGFVVHGYTGLEKFAQSTKTTELWPIIEKERPTLIIVEREDLLRRCFSVYQARTTQRWHVWKSNVGQNKLGCPKIQHHEVEWQLKCALASRKEGRQRFSWANFFTYEQIVDNWRDCMNQIQSLIGVDDVLPLAPKTAKQDRRPIQEMVSNYRELKDLFARTEYAQWFDLAEKNDEARAV